MFWLLDSLVDTFIFGSHFVTQLQSPSTFEIYFRLIVVSLIILFGFYGHISISKRKHVEEALKTSQRHREALFKALPVGVFHTDPDGLVVFANETTCEIAGVQPEEMLGFNWLQYLHPEDRDKVFSEIMQCQENQQIFESEYRFVRSDSKVVWVSDRTAPYLGQDGKLMGYIGTLVDITAYKQSVEALRLSEERLSKAFFNSPLPMSIVSLIDGRFITINKSFTQLLGYHFNEVVGNTSLELNLWENPERRGELFKDALEHGSVNEREVILRRKSGLTIEGIYSGEVIELNGEQCLLSVFNDLTEQKHMEREMVRLDRLFIVGEMAAGIAHEIRNPMTTVRGNLQLLGTRKENAHLKDYFSLMVSEIDRANSIITEYLNLAKDKVASKSEKNINTILQDLLPLIEADAAKDDKRIFTSLDKVPSLLVDDKEIRQLVVNLARNGLEAMHSGGIMLIRTYVEGEEVVLAVEDQGRGISTEVMDKIGTPFFTTKDYGTGLGLAICYSIASRHNASIKIETSPQGSIFFVRFKVSQGNGYNQAAATR